MNPTLIGYGFVRKVLEVLKDLLRSKNLIPNIMTML